MYRIFTHMPVSPQQIWNIRRTRNHDPTRRLEQFRNVTWLRQTSLEGRPPVPVTLVWGHNNTEAFKVVYPWSSTPWCLYFVWFSILKLDRTAILSTPAVQPSCSRLPHLPRFCQSRSMEQRNWDNKSWDHRSIPVEKTANRDQTALLYPVTWFNVDEFQWLL